MHLASGTRCCECGSQSLLVSGLLFCRAYFLPDWTPTLTVVLAGPVNFPQFTTRRCATFHMCCICPSQVSVMSLPCPAANPHNQQQAQATTSNLATPAHSALPCVAPVWSLPRPACESLQSTAGAAPPPTCTACSLLSPYSARHAIAPPDLLLLHSTGAAPPACTYVLQVRHAADGTGPVRGGQGSSTGGTAEAAARGVWL